MLHEAEEKRQVAGIHALFVQRQDQRIFRRVQQEVGIFHPFGNALVGGKLAHIILGKEGPQIGFADIGIDGQWSCPCNLMADHPASLAQGIHRGMADWLVPWMGWAQELVWGVDV